MMPSLASRRQCLSVLGSATLLSATTPAWSQFRVEVKGVGLRQIPVAIAPFRINAPQLPADVPAIVLADLERSGLFRPMPPGEQVLDENARPDVAWWRERGVDALVTGSVTRLADGRHDVRYRLWDVVKAQELGGMSLPVDARELRLTAHRIADQVYEKLLGHAGVFSTRIAYVVKQGMRYNLMVADADGENPQVALTSHEPIISPAWSPNGGQLAYVSFEARKPVIYTHELSSGKRRLLANFRGSNSAPAWSPDGAQLLATLTLGGVSQIYALDGQGGAPQRLSQSGSIDTEPAFSPDGKWIYFVSDRGGAPQIYRMDRSGKAVSRVTFDGSYNISPAISPDGRWMAYVSRVEGNFRLRLMELSSGMTTELTDTLADESPSFAPNSRMIIYATRHQGREALMTTTLDGRIKTRLASAPGNIREPDWGPYLK